MNKAPATLALLALAALFFWQAAVMQRAVGTQREKIMPGAVAITENMPPLVAFTTVALGGFRGLIADALWLRSTRMQEEGKYFELVQLADWITKLEPRFTPVWAFHAWNMAYNVSVLFDAPADRWRWVQAGIHLLRDEGIPNNPGDAQLYWELGWLYQHKIGQNLDQAHGFYKARLAAEMSILFTGRAPDFEWLLDAATSRETLRALPGVEPLFTEAAAEDIDLYNLLSLNPSDLSPGLLNRIRETEPGLELLRYLQKVQLETAYKLNVTTMKNVDDEFGPLDWRLPEAHAIYWAQRGLPHASSEFRRLQLQRMSFQGMSAAFRQGSAFIDIDGNLIPSPNIDVLPNVLKAYEMGLEINANAASVQTAHLNFMKEAITILYAYHHVEKARDLFRMIREFYPDAVETGDFDTFIIEMLREDIGQLSSRQAQAFVEGLWVQSYLWFALGDEARSAGSAQLASSMYRSYQAQFLSEEHEERVGLPPQDVLRAQAYERILREVPSEAARERLRTLKAPAPPAETAAP